MVHPRIGGATRDAGLIEMTETRLKKKVRAAYWYLGRLSVLAGLEASCYESIFAAGLEKYVKIIPAPARVIDVRLSIMARS